MASSAPKTKKLKGDHDNSKSRKYKKEWESQFVWLTEDKDGNAYCKLCRKSILPKVYNIGKHEKSVEHLGRIKGAQMTQPLSVISTPRRDLEAEKSVKAAEIQLAVGIACHCSIIAVDHIGEIVGHHGKGSTLGKIKLHRTKCSKLITDVVGVALKNELKSRVEGKHFCVLIDESTDLGAKKTLCVCIRFVDEIEAKIVTAFVGLVNVIEATGQTLFDALKEELATVGLDLTMCIGFASDGASVMVGQHNSVWSRIKDVSPNCLLMKCVCHSLALCVEHAFEKMPSNLGFLLKEIPKWFSKSTIKREAFKELIAIMDPNNDQQGKPLPFQKLCVTRWLVRGKVIYNLIVNWEELRAYFMAAEPASSADSRYKARMILNMLNDPVNFLYFHFLSPIISEFEKVNAFFQALYADPEEMVKELYLHHKSLRARIYDVHGKEKPLESVDFGAKFLYEAEKFMNAAQNRDLAKNTVNEISKRCHSFLLEAVSQVENRLPPAENVFRNLCKLSPRNILSQLDRLSYSALPLPHLIMDSMDSTTEEQYRKLLHVDWAAESVFNGTIPVDSVQFWTGILKYENSLGTRPFKELAEYALRCLTTPVSNAVCERIFSTVTSIKTKTRCRMGNKMLGAILRIRTFLKFGEKCCRDFQASEEMLSLVKSEMYTNTTATTSTDASDESLDMEMDTVLSHYIM